MQTAAIGSGSPITATMNLIDEAIAANPKAVEDVKAGKEKALGRIIGYIRQRDKLSEPTFIMDQVRIRCGLAPITQEILAEKKEKHDAAEEEWKAEREREKRRPIYHEKNYYENVGPDRLTSDWIREHGTDVGATMIHITGGLNSYGEGTEIDVTFKSEEVLTLEGRKKLYGLGVPKSHVVYHYQNWWDTDGSLKWRDELDGTK